MTEFSKIKLRTKVKCPVVSVELAKREIVFSNYEKVIYVKDLEGNMLVFLPNDDSKFTESNTLSAKKIKELIDGASSNFDVLDGGTW